MIPAMTIGGLLLGYGGFDGTREFGAVWQIVGFLAGAATGALGGFLLWVYLVGNFSDEE
jgi:hypothetical protein